jgi:hypothetical protein
MNKILKRVSKNFLVYAKYLKTYLSSLFWLLLFYYL